jgi:cytochrome c553
VPPPWAYGFDAPLSQQTTSSAQAAVSDPNAKRANPDERLRSLPGSKFQFTAGQIRDGFGPADWYPEDHPEMPDIVAHGKKPDVMACALCHYPNGKGRPENAPLAGLPVAYFIEQIQSFRDGTRRSADTRKTNTNLMIAAAAAMTTEEIMAAATYFGSMSWTPWIKVVETEWVPQTKPSGGMFLPVKGAPKELLGERIIEVPQDVEAVEALRSPRVGFIAYVPIGSIKRGSQLAGTGAGMLACGSCHGADLSGAGSVPGIAGRSPSYIVRQIFDIKAGTRHSAGALLMKPVISQLEDRDMIALAAYVASLDPATPGTTIATGH